jgi:hypothetical protein
MGEGRGMCRVWWEYLRERPRRRWEDYIQGDHQQKGCKVWDWIELAKNRLIWWAFVNAIMNSRVP